jgi:hypothetical protein
LTNIFVASSVVAVLREAERVWSVLDSVIDIDVRYLTLVEEQGKASETYFDILFSYRTSWTPAIRI